MEGERCLRGRDEQLGSIKDRAKIWNKHMEKIVTKENKWDHVVESDAIEGSVKKVAHDEIVEAMQNSKQAVAPILGSQSTCKGLKTIAKKIHTLEQDFFYTMHKFFLSFNYLAIFLYSGKPDWINTS